MTTTRQPTGAPYLLPSTAPASSAPTSPLTPGPTELQPPETSSSPTTTLADGTTDTAADDWFVPHVCSRINGASVGFVGSTLTLLDDSASAASAGVGLSYRTLAVVAPGTARIESRIGDGPIVRSAPVSSAQRSASNADAIVLVAKRHATTVYEDSVDSVGGVAPAARVAFHVYGERSHLPIFEGVVVNTIIAPSEALAALLGDEVLVPELTIPSSESLRPGVVSVLLPAAAFGAARSQQPYNLWVDLELTAVRSPPGPGALINATALVRIHIHPRPPAPAWGSFAVSVPQRPILPGDTILIPVSSGFGRLLQTVQIVVRVSGPGVSLESFEIDEATGWTGRTNTGDGTGAFLAGTFTRSSLSSAMQTTPDVLVRIIARVSATATPGTASLSVTIEQAADAIGDLVAGDVTVSDRSSGADSDAVVTTGHLFVEEPVTGVFAVVQVAELWNAAVIAPRFTATRRPLTLWAVTPAGLEPGRRSDFTCSADAAVMSAAGCASSFVGTETGGGEAVVTVQHRTANVTATQRFDVWFPELPIDISLTNPVLRRVGGWRGNGCSRDEDSGTTPSRYQRTRVQATARFALAGAGTLSFAADVSNEVTLQSTNASVAGVTSDGSVDGCFPLSVQAVGTGAAEILVIGSANRQLASVRVTVPDESEPAAVADRLVLRSFRGLTSLSPGAGPPGAQHQREVVVQLDQTTMTQPGDQIELAAAVAFTDGTWMDLRPSEYAVRTNAPGTLTATAGATNAFTVPTPGQNQNGAALEATWPVEPCTDGDGSPDGLVAPVTLPVDVSLPAATGVDARLEAVVPSDPNAGLVQDTPRLVPPGNDALTALRLPYRAAFRVDLLYGSARMTYPSRSNSTIISLVPQEGHEGMVTLSRAAGERYVVAVAPTATDGDVTFRISFLHENISAEMTVHIATFADLAVTAGPYPRYGGSAPGTAIALAPIESSPGTVISWQRAELWATVHLSNGEAIRFIQATTVFTADVENPAAWASNSGPNGRGSVVWPVNNTGGFAAAATGAEVRATYGSLTSSEALTVEVSSMPVRPAEITGLALRSRLPHGRCAAVDATRALYGTPGNAVAEITADIVLTDGRHYPSIYFGDRWDCIPRNPQTNGSALLPTLLSFASDSVSLRVDAASGEVTLHNNTDELTTITATVDTTAVGGAVSHIIQTWGNMDPAGPGDLDLGMRFGEALPPRRPGDVFVVPLRTRITDRSLRSFNIDLFFDSAVVRVDGGGPDFRSAITNAGNFVALAVTVNPAGMKIVGSLETSLPTNAGIVELVGIRFVAVDSGTTRFGGRVIEMLSSESESVDLEHTFEAGQVLQVVAGGRRRQLIHASGSGTGGDLLGAGSSRPARQETDRCVPGGCVGDVDRQRGDVNGDCCFTLADSLDIIKWVEATALQSAGQPLSADAERTVARLTAALGASTTNRRWADADGNGRELELLDAVYLNDVVGNAKVLLDPVDVTISADEPGVPCRVRLMTGAFGAGGLPPADRFTLHYRMAGHGIPVVLLDPTTSLGALVAPSVEYNLETVFQATRVTSSSAGVQFGAEFAVQASLDGVTIPAVTVDVTYWGRVPPESAVLIVGPDHTTPSSNLFFSEFTYSVRAVVSTTLGDVTSLCRTNPENATLLSTPSLGSTLPSQGIVETVPASTQNSITDTTASTDVETDPASTQNSITDTTAGTDVETDPASTQNSITDTTAGTDVETDPASTQNSNSTTTGSAGIDGPSSTARSTDQTTTATMATVAATTTHLLGGQSTITSSADSGTGVDVTAAPSDATLTTVDPATAPAAGLTTVSHTSAAPTFSPHAVPATDSGPPTPINPSAPPPPPSVAVTGGLGASSSTVAQQGGMTSVPVAGTTATVIAPFPPVTRTATVAAPTAGVGVHEIGDASLGSDNDGTAPSDTASGELVAGIVIALVLIGIAATLVVIRQRRRPKSSLQSGRTSSPGSVIAGIESHEMVDATNNWAVRSGGSTKTSYGGDDKHGIDVDGVATFFADIHDDKRAVGVGVVMNKSVEMEWPQALVIGSNGDGVDGYIAVSGHGEAPPAEPSRPPPQPNFGQSVRTGEEEDSQFPVAPGRPPPQPPR